MIYTRYDMLIGLVIMLISLTNNFHYCLSSPSNLKDSDQNFWKNEGKKAIDDALKIKKIKGQAKNVIMFIGDGMGIATITSGRIFKGQLKGESGEEGYLTFEKFDNIGLLKTYNTDRQIPDSAGTATALFSGVKAKYYTLGYDGNIKVNACTTDIDNSRLTTVIDWAIKEKKRTGFVTTTRITHATPAASYAHSAHRDWECDTKIPAEERDKHCIDIARQLVEGEPGLSINVLLGGGEQVLRSSINVTTKACVRGDGKDLVQSWLDSHSQRGNRHKYIRNKGELNNINEAEIDYLFGLFAPGHMPYDKDRDLSDNGQPSLEEMTLKALKILKQSNDGFLLIVEGGRIDHAHHVNLAKIALEEMVAFDLAIESALEMIDLKETLVLVTADHSHAFAMSGYASRGNDIAGIGNFATPEGFLYHTLGYINGPGYIHHRLNSSDSNLNTSTTNTWRSYNDSIESGSKREEPHFAGFWMDDETHGGEDVPIYALGPWAHLFHGVHEQTFVSYVVAYSSCIGPYSANNCPFNGGNKSTALNSSILIFFLLSILAIVSNYLP